MSVFLEGAIKALSRVHAPDEDQHGTPRSPINIDEMQLAQAAALVSIASSLAALVDRVEEGRDVTTTPTPVPKTAPNLNPRSRSAGGQSKADTG